MSLIERKAANSRPSTSTMDRNSANPMPSATVPNSSSLSGTCPVRRTVTPSGARLSSLTIWRTAAVAFAPGCRAWKSRLGCARISLRSSRGSTGRSAIMRQRQHSGISLPVRAELTDSEIRDSRCSSEAKSIALFATPSIASDSISNRPRRLVSADRVPMKALRLDHRVGGPVQLLGR
jgi:hypothetical protein